MPPRGAAGKAAAPGPGADMEKFSSSLDSMFVFHLRELNSILASQQEQTRTFVNDTVEASRTIKLENQELRHQIANLKLAVDPKKFAKLGDMNYQALLGKQIGQANKILVKRDREAREAAAENAALRETLAAMAASPLGPSSPLPPGMMPDGPEPPSRPGSAGKPVAVPNLRFSGSDSDLVSEMKLRNQPFDDGIIDLDEDDSSDDDIDPSERPFSGKAKKGQVKVMDMKARMRNMMTSAKYDVADCYHTTGWFQALARHYVFENLTMMIIVLNAAWIGVDTVFNHETLLSDADPTFIIAENLFCLYFVFELLVRLGAFKYKSDAFKDMWFDFDTALVILMVSETWVMFTILTVTNENVEFGGSPALRLLKLVRLSRVARMAKLMRLMPEVMVLIKGIGVAARSVFFTLCLLWMMIYVFAVAFTQLLAGTTPGTLYFPDLGTSMFTLFFRICFGDALGDVAESCFKESAFFGLLLLSFTTIAPLTVLNMVTGILVEVVRVVASFEQEAMDTLYVSEQLQMVFDELDKNGDGQVSLEEFSQIMEKETAVSALCDVGIDTFALADDPEIIFQGEEQISFGEFVRELMQIRNANTATIKDVQFLRRHISEDMAWYLDRHSALEGKKDKKKTKKKKSKRSSARSKPSDGGK